MTGLDQHWFEEYQGKPYQDAESYYRDLRYMMETYLQSALLLKQAEQKSFEELLSLKKEIAAELIQVKNDIALKEKITEPLLELPFYQAVKKWHLSPFERFCFLLGSMFWWKRDYGDYFARLQSGGERYAVWGLAVTLFSMADVLTQEELGRCSGGRGSWKKYFQMRSGESGESLWRQEPVILKKELMYLFGEEKYLPGQIAERGILWNLEQKPQELLCCEQEKKQLIHMSMHLRSGRVIGVCGKTGSGRMLLLKHVSHESHRNLLFVEAGMLEAERLEEIKERLLLASLIYEAGLCLILSQGGQNREAAQQILEQIAREIQPLYYIAQEPLVFSSFYIEEQIKLYLRPATLQQKTKFWSYFLQYFPMEKQLKPQEFASHYTLNAGEIKQTLHMAYLRVQSQGRTTIRESDLMEELKHKHGDLLGDYAFPVKVVYSWEDFIVGQGILERLHQICIQVRYQELVGEQWGFYQKKPYGRGISVLFSGAPGTGKTMAAQVIAKELGMELYRIDISRMMSKYIGETQKNITALFQSAKTINVILFFDEADALFTKRTEVSDANDRHANSEVAHLLQQIEEYQGLVILATNLKENLDEAFRRRIQFVIDFQLPDLELRKRLWHQMFPPQAPREEGLNLDFFAERFELSGSEIKETLVQAAFLAAAENCPIGREQLKKALTFCMEKYGRILNQADFRDLK